MYIRYNKTIYITIKLEERGQAGLDISHVTLSQPGTAPGPVVAREVSRQLLHLLGLNITYKNGKLYRELL